MSSEHPSSLSLLNSGDIGSTTTSSCGSPRSICSPATTQYHAQLYSGQQQLQKRFQQQQQLQNDFHHHQQEQSTISVIERNNSHNNNSNNHSHNHCSNNNNNNNHTINLPPRQLTFVPPNLYRTSLQLATELDIHAWWATLIDILTGSSFHAIRVCLSVPQDVSDAWTGAWGLKAAWSKSGAIRTTPPQQEQLQQDQLQQQHSQHSNDYFVHTHTNSNNNNNNDNDNNNSNNDNENYHDARYKCFDRLQSLDYESEPLINNPSAHRIIRRNTIIILSREYRPRSSSQRPPFHFQHHHHDDSRDMFKRALLEHSEKCNNTTTRRVTCHSALAATTSPRLQQEGSMLASGIGNNGGDLVDFSSTEILADSPQIEYDNIMMPTTSEADFQELYDYDEYEQQQPSPWSQSPAPSPAMMDPDINPFFQSTPGIDDEAFNPASPESYHSSNIPFPPPASNVHSVIHIPLVHTSPQKTTAQDELQSNSTNSTLTSTSTSTIIDSSHQQQTAQKNTPAPIAILSFLSPVVPYPSNLVSSLNALSPFIATSFSNALEHSRYDNNNNLMRRGSARRRPSMKQQRLRKKSGEDILGTNGIQAQHETVPDSTSSTTTPNATSPYQQSGANPTFLGSMTNFAKNSLETVAEQRPEDDPRLWSASSMSSYKSAFSVQPTTMLEDHEQLQETQEEEKEEKEEKEGGRTPIMNQQVQSRSSSISLERALSSSSLSIIDALESQNINGNVEPVTPSATGSTTTTIINDEGESNIVDDNEEENIVHEDQQCAEQSRSKKRVITKRLRPRTRTRVRWRAYGSTNNSGASSAGRSVDKSNDSGFTKDGIEHLFVAPKSSLLRLVIDGIPIHVL